MASKFGRNQRRKLRQALIEKDNALAEHRRARDYLLSQIASTSLMIDQWRHQISRELSQFSSFLPDRQTICIDKHTEHFAIALRDRFAIDAGPGEIPLSTSFEYIRRFVHWLGVATENDKMLLRERLSVRLTTQDGGVGYITDIENLGAVDSAMIARDIAARLMKSLEHRS